MNEKDAMIICCTTTDFPARVTLYNKASRLRNVRIVPGFLLILILEALQNIDMIHAGRINLWST